MQCAPTPLRGKDGDLPADVSRSSKGREVSSSSKVESSTTSNETSLSPADQAALSRLVQRGSSRANAGYSAQGSAAPASDSHFVWGGVEETSTNETTSSMTKSGKESPKREVERAVSMTAYGQPIWSKGSTGHEEGSCKPCLFFQTKVGCNKGVECTFCHIQHKRKERTRPCKGKRDRYKKLVSRIAEQEGANKLVSKILEQGSNLKSNSFGEMLVSNLIDRACEIGEEDQSAESKTRLSL